MSRSGQLTAFTLFVHPGKGWQMNTRREDENAWSITTIPDEQAAAILSMLETSGHPDGPWTVKPQLTIAKHIELPDNATSEDVGRAFAGLRATSVQTDLETELAALSFAVVGLTEIINGMA